MLFAPAAAKSAPAPVFQKISTQAPSWYTKAFHERVMAAGDRGVAIPTGVSVTASSTAFLGIRPGQQIIIGNLLGGFSLCTSNFVFKQGDNYWIGTAGHCGKVGEPVSMIFLPNAIANIGTITKSTGDAGIGDDFALISIRQSLNNRVSPSMAHWGGPKFAYAGTTAPNIVKHTGHGLGIGTGGTPRLGFGIYYSSTRYTFLGLINKGDSGGPANTGNNQALGNITHISVDLSYGIGTVAGTSIRRILQVAGVPLATCAKALPWPSYGCPPGL